MNILDLADLLLSPDEKKELQTSKELLEKSNYSAFYESNQDIIKSIWTFQKKTALIKNVIALLFSALTVTVSRSAAMRMT